MKTLITILFFFYTESFAQSFSVHNTDKQTYGKIERLEANVPENQTEIIPLQFEKSELTASVFGYLPYWEYPTARNYLRYDLLTHIALFDFAADSLGNLKNPPYWPWTDVINKAHQNGVKVILSSTNFEASQMHQLLNSDSAKQNLFSNLKNKVESYKLDGVNIDFEEYYSSDRGDLLNGFMTALTNYLHTAIPNCEVSFAGPAINGSGWKLTGLANACDYIFIMGYAFAGKWSDYTGSNAPLLGGTYNITNTITKQYADVIKSNPKKLILGVPYYGNRWQTKTQEPHAAVVNYGYTTRFRDDVSLSQTYGLLWENNEKTPWYRWKLNDTTWYQVWFDNDSSLGLKYDLAKSYKLKGIGMWALGYDGSRTDLWNAIEKRFITSAVKEKKIAEPKFLLSQNYPNPFNPVTSIQYSVVSRQFISLKVYDILGNEIETLVNEEKAPGIYTIPFNLQLTTINQQLSSGVYFYQLRAGNFLQTKKMLYLK
ncbi:MAG: glycosyl hydrolase family 18 protein [Ignavibacteriaceae bacterium]|jgi:spore germination protein YaaH|nr:glycosyl hydrolase family 18 protein [Ignavibacteriaceae bacterium]